MLKANEPLIEGIEFTVGGETYTAAPLTLGLIKVALKKLSGNTAEVLSDILTMSLRLNYPEAAQPWLDSNMTGAEFRANEKKLVQLLELSGLIRPTDEATGEAPAAA